MKIVMEVFSLLSISYLLMLKFLFWIGYEIKTYIGRPPTKTHLQ